MCACVVADQMACVCPMIRQRILAMVEYGYPGGHALLQPLRNRVPVIMKDGSIEHEVTVHRCWAKGVNPHDVVDGTVRGLGELQCVMQLFIGIALINSVDPCNHYALSNRSDWAMVLEFSVLKR